MAHPLCETVTTDTSFGQGCSGTGSGNRLCAFEDPRCGTDKCVYDSRGSTFSFVCGSKCTVGGAARCPIGYECVAPDPGCAGNAASGVCTEQAAFDCIKVDVSVGKVIEGPAGEVLVIGRSKTSGKGVLVVRQNGTLKELLALDDSGLTYGVKTARSSDSLLIVTDTQEILFKEGAAKAFPRKAGRTSSVYSTNKDGTFVALELQNGTASYAALSKRNEDGTWTEVGPTRQRLTNLVALNSGFVARCDAKLCASADGEDFTAVGLPAGVTLQDATASSSASTIVAAGASPADLYAAIDGALYHYRKGNWVTETPKAAPPAATDGGAPAYRYPDVVRVSSAGAVAFDTYDAASRGYTTYVLADTCWGSAARANLDNATLAKDAFVYASTSGTLCSRPAK